jgi:hypothetical protein
MFVLTQMHESREASLYKTGVLTVNAPYLAVTGEVAVSDSIHRLAGRVTISKARMHPQSRLSLFAILLLLISSGNVYGIGLALWYHNADSLRSSEALPDKWGTIAIVLLACSQVLYLIFFFASLFRWFRLYPGNPVQTVSIACGFLLSTTALLTSSFGLGLKRLIGIIIAFTTALLWLISAIGSVAV